MYRLFFLLKIKYRSKKIPFFCIVCGNFLHCYMFTSYTSCRWPHSNSKIRNITSSFSFMLNSTAVIILFSMPLVCSFFSNITFFQSIFGHNYIKKDYWMKIYPLFTVLIKEKWWKLGYGSSSRKEGKMISELKVSVSKFFERQAETIQLLDLKTMSLLVLKQSK